MATKKKAKAPTKSHTPRKKNREINKPDTCFMIMPFGEWFDSYYDRIYLPAIDAAGLVPRRADDLYRPSAIINDIWTMTQEAKLILADLSGKNPNVFYELGMAHALAKPAILVTETMDDVPFDLRALRVIVYEKNRPDWGDALREKIQSAIEEVLESPLEAVLPTFIKVKETSSQPTASKVEKELISLRQDMDMLKRDSQLREGFVYPQSQPLVLPRPTPVSAPAREALEYARAGLRAGVSEDQLIRELSSRFPLRSSELAWVMNRVQAVRPHRSEASDTSAESKEVEDAKAT